jgi:hypothetical protein
MPIGQCDRSHAFVAWLVASTFAERNGQAQGSSVSEASVSRMRKANVDTKTILGVNIKQVGGVYKEDVEFTENKLGIPPC